MKSYQKLWEPIVLLANIWDDTLSVSTVGAVDFKNTSRITSTSFFSMF